MMQTNQIRISVKPTKRKAKTRAGRLQAYESTVKMNQPLGFARLDKYGMWDARAANKSHVVIYRKGEEPT
jgi:hypothetical protein